MDLHIRTQVNRLTILRGNEMRQRGEAGPEGSVAKVVTGKLNQLATELCVDLLGMDGQLFGSYAISQRSLGSGGAEDSPQRSFLRARANTIEGGTSEILRNILSERVLGLPPEARVDKDKPWGASRL